MGKPWTATKPLPGGDIAVADLTNFEKRMQQQFASLPAALIKRYVHNYGTLIFKLLQNVRSLTDLGDNFGVDLYEREVAYLIKHEFARTAEDILWRRTKLGLHFPTSAIAKLDHAIHTILNISNK